MSALLSVLFDVGLVSVLAVAWLVGYVQGYRRRARRTPKPICGCGHHVAFHNENGCHCSPGVDRWDRPVECGCLHYVGPGPDPEFLP